jgi:hypothetical protein
MKKSPILRRFSLTFGMMLSLICIGGYYASGQVTILVNKGKFATVEEAANADDKVNWIDADRTDDRACTECFATTELAHFLPFGSTVAEVKIETNGKLPNQGDVILLGSRLSNKLINTLKVPQSGELKTDQSFRIQTLQQNNRTITVIEGKDRIGTLYGVYEYLKQLGIRFYGLGEQGTVYPATKSGLPQNLSILENPSFLSRGFIGLGNRGDMNMYLWMVRNRMNYCDEGSQAGFRHKLGMVLVRGGHGVQGEFIPPQGEYPYNYPLFKGDENKPKDPYAVSKEYKGDLNGDGKLTYFEAHPEWYGLRNGKRSPKADVSPGDNYCTSNMDANQELAKNMVQSLINGRWKNVDIANFWMLDNGKWCECDNCKKQGELSDRLFDVAYVVQKKIKNAQRDGRLNRNVLLATLAYHETLPPPERALPKDFDYDNFSVTFFPIERCYVHTFDDPNCTEINKFLYDNYKGWAIDPNRNYKGSMLLGEYYNVSSFKSLPILFTKIMAYDIPWYYNTGTRHLNYMHTPTHLWGTWTLNQYLLASLLWNHQTKVDQLLNEYFTRFYPTTTEHTRKFYQYLEEATANLKPFKHYAGKNIYKMRTRLARDTMNIFPLDHLHYDVYHPEKNDGPDVVEMVDLMKKARTELDAAMLQCKNKTEEARLNEDAKRFEYGEATIDFYNYLVRTALLHRSGEEASAKLEFKKAKYLADKLRNMTDVVAPLSGTGRGGDANAANGFEAAQVDAEYEYFRKKYDN